MMWSLLFFLAAGGLVKAAEDCSQPTEEACDLAGFILTVSDKEFSPDCKMIMESLECIIRVEERCHFDDNFLAFAKSSRDAIKPRCELEESGKAETGIPQVMYGKEDCSVPTEKACNIDIFADTVGPEVNTDERCRNLLKTTQCMIRVEEKCHFDDDVLQVAKDTLPMLQRACGREKTTSIGVFHGSKARLECIRNVLNAEKTGHCADPPCKFKLIKYAEALLNKGVISEVDVKSLVCIGGISVFSCIAASVEKRCGKIAFNEYVETFESMPGDTIIGCQGSQIRDFFPVLLQTYKENERTETLLRNVFRTSNHQTL